MSRGLSGSHLLDYRQLFPERSLLPGVQGALLNDGGTRGRRCGFASEPHAAGYARRLRVSFEARPGDPVLESNPSASDGTAEGRDFSIAIVVIGVHRRDDSNATKLAPRGVHKGTVRI